jgi:hypothetical protein
MNELFKLLAIARARADQDDDGYWQNAVIMTLSEIVVEMNRTTKNITLTF